MRMLTIVLTAMAVPLVAGWAEAKTKTSKENFLFYKEKKLGKDYYVVRTGQSNQCSIVTGTPEEKPAGAVRDAPYASNNYAKAALKTFAECKGGEVDKATDDKGK